MAPIWPLPRNNLSPLPLDDDLSPPELSRCQTPDSHYLFYKMIFSIRWALVLDPWWGHQVLQKSKVWESVLCFTHTNTLVLCFRNSFFNCEGGRVTPQDFTAVRIQIRWAHQDTAMCDWLQKPQGQWRCVLRRFPWAELTASATHPPGGPAPQPGSSRFQGMPWTHSAWPCPCTAEVLRASEEPSTRSYQVLSLSITTSSALLPLCGQTVSIAWVCVWVCVCVKLLSHVQLLLPHGL